MKTKKNNTFKDHVLFRETPGADDVYSAWFFDLAGTPGI